MALDARAVVRRLRGVTTNPALYEVTKAVAAEQRAWEPDDVLALAVALRDDGYWPRQAGVDLVARHRKTLRSLKTRDVEVLAKGMDRWEVVDHLAMRVSGPVWHGGGLTDTAVARWARSRDLWWRRFALATCVFPGRKGGCTKPILAVCAALADDREDMVVKALSWALRELTKSDKPAVAAFVREHDGQLAARVLREVDRKLRTGKKN